MPNSYIMAAALVEDEDAESVRHLVSKLKPKRHKKLHWNEEPSDSRLMIATTLSNCRLVHVVVVRTGVPGDRPERRRRHCLERLAYELHLFGITSITAEARDGASNRRELEYLNRMRSAQRISSALRLHHVPGPGEPLLWIADAVAGAVGISRRPDGTSEYVDCFDGMIQIVDM
ncbi:DUF3800 domain-containing protein [Stackebrandtia albiflava]|uniref:DUF3800 domain-containing protein n=1 Tax=Stackebrandtia albiflava TaxID=406432 RepID=UPI0011BDFEE2|nr:DUF3800 domain-containing protein [Stackebrandtia albiflava]